MNFMWRRELSEGLKAPIYARLDLAARAFLDVGEGKKIDFASPKGEPAILEPDSVSWRIFKNPVSLFIGGVTAVLMEFAEPRVRAGVWNHSTFRTAPVTRLKRTGLAAMVTVYGARSVAERMIAGVRRMHENVEGLTEAGAAYSANDVELLNWVQATANFGFLNAYHHYVEPLSERERARFYGEGGEAARLYGALGAPSSEREQAALFSAMTPKLEPSPIIFEFIQIMRHAPALPGPLQFAQRVFVRAAVDLVPAPIRSVLGLGSSFGLRPLEGRVVGRLGRRADRLLLPSAPPAQACVRLGLPEDYLYVGRA